MRPENSVSVFILGVSIFLGLSVLGYQLAGAAIHFKEYERSVTVKGLSERELPANIVIWPIVLQRPVMILAVYMRQLMPVLKKSRIFLLQKELIPLKFQLPRRPLPTN